MYKYMFPTWCYIIQEGSDPTDFCKVGVTCDDLHERLRRLQQGNPRDLRFQYLFIGESAHIKRLETLVKESCNSVGGSRTEWFKKDPSKMREIILKKIKVANLYKSNLSSNSFLKFQKEIPETINVYWMFGVLLTKNSPISRNELMNYLYENGVETITTHDYDWTFINDYFWD